MTNSGSSAAKSSQFASIPAVTSLVHRLRQHRFLAQLSEAQLAQLGAITEEVSFEKDQVILRTRQQSKDFYLLSSGSVCIELHKERDTLCIQVLGPGGAFGWSSLLEHHDTLFQVRARERSTALRLDGNALTAILRTHPAFAAELLRRSLHLVASRVQAAEARLGEVCGIRMPKHLPVA